MNRTESLIPTQRTLQNCPTFLLETLFPHNQNHVGVHAVYIVYAGIHIYYIENTIKKKQATPIHEIERKKKKNPYLSRSRGTVCPSSCGSSCVFWDGLSSCKTWSKPRRRTAGRSFEVFWCRRCLTLSPASRHYSRCYRLTRYPKVKFLSKSPTKLRV
jgi:hypothetical protein